MKRFAFILSIAIVLWFSTYSWAYLTYNDQSLFLQSTGDYIIDDYQNPCYLNQEVGKPNAYGTWNNTQMSSILGETQYESTFWGNNTVYRQSDTDNFYYCAGCNGTFRLTFTQTTVGSSSGVFGAGFSVYSNDPTSSPNHYVAFVTFGDGSSLNLELPGGSQPNPVPFWGITSATMITSIHVGLPGGTPTNYGGFIMDDLIIASHPVPEPTSLLFLGIGLMGLAGVRKRLVGKK